MSEDNETKILDEFDNYVFNLYIWKQAFNDNNSSIPDFFTALNFLYESSAEKMELLELYIKRKSRYMYKVLKSIKNGTFTKNMIDCSDVFCFSPLHYSIMEKNVDVSKLIITKSQYKESPEFRNIDLETSITMEFLR